MSSLTEKIGEVDVEFPYLPLPDYESIQAACKAAIDAETKAQLDQCQIKGAERYVALRDGIPKFIGPDLVDAYLGTSEGVTRTLKASLKKAGRSEEAVTPILAQIDLLQGRDIALRVIKFRKPEKAVEPETSGQQNPSAST